MTASELRYLAAINDLDDQGKGARMAAMSQKLNVSKVSVYRAIERLIASGYVGQNGKRVLLTDKGRKEVTDYLSVVEFIGEKLIKYCNTPKELAFDEAIGAACSLGGESRNGVLAYVKSKTAE